MQEAAKPHLSEAGLFQSMKWENKPVPKIFGVRAAATSLGSHSTWKFLVLRFGIREEECVRVPVHTLLVGARAYACVMPVPVCT